ncbi:MAG: hypothetical protein ACO3UY_06685 [Opitutales bacterium]
MVQKNKPYLATIPTQDNDNYEGAPRDPLVQEFEQAMPFIKNQNNRCRIEEKLQQQDALSQVARIHERWNNGEWDAFWTIMRQLMVDQADNEDTRLPILIIDEVQDFYWGQLKAIVRFYISQFPMTQRSQHLYSLTTCPLGDQLQISWEAVGTEQGRLIILAGDNSQRVTFSGFSWANFAKTFTTHFTNSELYAPDAFQQNYRNTTAIARVANYFLSSQHTDLRAFNIETENSTWIDTPPDPEHCLRPGSRPFLIEVDNQWVESLVKYLKLKLRELGEDERFIFIAHDAECQPFWEQIEVSRLSEEVENQKFFWETIADAKGREFKAVTLVYPFSRRPDRPAVSELFKWYTSLTRAKDYLAILVSAEEMQWLRNTVRSFEDLEIICRINDQESLSPEAFAEELFKEGKDTVTQEELFDRAFTKIRNWLAGDVQRPDFLLKPFRNVGNQDYSDWMILGEVENCNGKLQVEIPVDAEPLDRLTLEDSQPLNALFIYLAILPLLAESSKTDFAKIMDRQVLAALEQYTGEFPHIQEADLSSPIRNCLIWRAKGDSWQAVNALRENNEQIVRFLYRQISQDLEERGLPWEATRLRHRYLDELIDDNLPFHELMEKSDDLPSLLIYTILDQVDSLKSIN